MKKFLVVVVLIFTIAMMGVGCTNTSAQSSGSGSSGAGGGSTSAGSGSSGTGSGSSSTGSGSSSSASTSQAAAQSTATVSLKGNASTGYTWLYTADPTGIVKEKSSSYALDSNLPDPPPGTGGTFVFEFEAVKEGEAELVFFYTRTWENSPAINVATYKAVVDAGGSLKITPVDDKVQRTAVITLEGNITTGYTWVYVTQPEGIVIEKSRDYIPDPNPQGADGVGGTHVFVFESMSEGTAELNFHFLREGDSAPASKIVTFKAVVDASGNLKITQVSNS